MAFITKAKRGGKPRWRLIWKDATRGAGRVSRRWADCVGGDHREAMIAAGLSPDERAALALGATNAVLRSKLVRCYEALERERARDAARAGGPGRGTRYETPLLDKLDEVLEGIQADVAARQARGGRAGKSSATLATYQEAVTKLRDYLRQAGLERVTTGEVTLDLLRGFRDHLSRAVSPAMGKPLAPGTVNRHMGSLRALIGRFQDDDDPRPFFRLSGESIRRALSKVADERKLPECFSSDELGAFLEAAWAMDHREAVQVVRRKPRSDRVESFGQSVSVTPLFRLVAILMLTGCRRHEALGLRWSDVDLDQGTIIIRSRKTGRERMLPLEDDNHPVSPGLLSLLRTWRFQEPEATFVLPANGRDGEPAFPKRPWLDLCRAAGVEIKPKALRSNWTSHMVSLGRPVSLVAVWAGHSPAVLEKHYLDYARLRKGGRDLDEAMGLTSAIRLARGQKAELSNLSTARKAHAG